MAQGRLLHAATLLASGKVLVVGGYNRTAELYDPSTGTWSRTGDALAAHRYHTLTLLEDGRALLAGGGKDAKTGASAALYDPGTGQWSPAGKLLTYRSRHAAASLPSGKVLVVGGVNSSGAPLSSAELYDPATGVWTPTGSMGAARSDPSATLLPSGQVLVAGGANGSGSPLGSAELYDPAAGTWTAAGSMARARRYHTATLLPSGKVLVTGGGSSNQAEAASAELYDPSSGTWSTTGSMGTPRRYHSATLLPGGQVLIAGGYHEYTGTLTDCELYQPVTGAWSSTARLAVERYGHTATLLPDGAVLAAGGFSNVDQASAELYQASAPPTGTPPSGTSLLLQVVDSAGAPIPAAAISSQGAVFPLDSSGHILFEELPAGRFLAQVQARGYTAAAVVLDLEQGAHVGHQVKLLPLGQPVPFQAEQGGLIETQSVRVTIPPGAVVDLLGRPVTGQVEVTVAPLDPTVQMDSLPGPLEGIPARGDVVQLESFFMAEVSLWANGAPAQLAPGASATLEFLLPEAMASQFQPGDTVPAWWFDLEAGQWREEGQGTIQLSQSHPGRLSWILTVSHFTWWNCDRPWTDKSCVDVLVVDELGQPAGNVLVSAQGVSYTGYSGPRYTGADGRTCIEIKRGNTASAFAALFPASAVTVTGSSQAAVCGAGPCSAATLVIPERICLPGAYEGCPYSGPPGTQGQGLCRAGYRRCNTTGTAWSACQGEVLPTTESCRSPFDEDCDGAVNEDCTCEGEGAPCYTGPEGTNGVGICRSGTTRCNLFGETYCQGQRTPLPETCMTLEDDDCDGANECAPSAPWTQLLSGPDSEDIVRLDVDASGNMLVAGSFYHSLDIGGHQLTSSGFANFVAKLDASGQYAWGHVVTPGQRWHNGSQPSVDIQMDDTGNTIVVGGFSGPLRFGPLTLSSSGGAIFVAKISPSGELLWARVFSSDTGDAMAGSTAVDSMGHIVITGPFSGNLTFGGTTLSGAGIYVAKLDAGTGEPIWSQRGGGQGQLEGRDVAVDEQGNVLLVGSYGGQPSMAGTILPLPPSLPERRNYRDVFILKLDGSNGTLVWVKTFDWAANYDFGWRVATDGGGGGLCHDMEPSV